MEKTINDNLLVSKRFHFYETIVPKVQNVINESIIFNYLKENSAISRAKISKDLKISAPTVSKIIDNLIRNNYVNETEKAESSGGKRATKLVFNGDIGYTIGIDLSKKRVILAQTDFQTNIINKDVGFKIIHTDENILDKLIEEIKLFIKKHDISVQKKSRNRKIIVIGVGVPANADLISGKIISAPLFKNWLNLDLKSCLEKEFDMPVYVENIVNLSAIGENNFGIGQKINNLVFLEISNGIGAGIIIDGNLYRGSTSSAGEIGFTVTKCEDLHFKYNIKGKLEKEISIENIENKVLKDIKNGQKTKISSYLKDDFSDIDINMICEAAYADDDYAKSVLNKVAEEISIAVINLILILNPKLIVIGGQISTVPHMNELIIKPLKKNVKNIIPFNIPDIKVSMLGENAGVIGASFMASDLILANKFPYRIVSYN